MSGGRVIAVVLVMVGLSLVAVGLVGAAGAFGGPALVAAPSQPTSAPPSTPPAATEPPMVVPSSSPSPTAAPTVAPTADVEALVRAFFVELEAALREGRAGDMVDALAPAVIERYGRAACEAQLGGQAPEPSRAFEILEIGPPASWDYERDGLSTTIGDAIPVRVRVTGPTPSGDATTEAELHVQLVDDQVRWFSDCGTPLG